jgi:hypothetical protein
MNKTVFFGLKLLIMLLIFIGFFVYIYFVSKDPKKKFPPWKSKCPDFWQADGSNRCLNSKKLGYCMVGDDNMMTFDDPVFKTDKSDYYKCKWAKNCGVSWEGIDNLCI